MIDRLGGTKPARDMVATDGQTLTLGDTTITLYVTPGHTPGTLSVVIPVRDGRQAAPRGALGRDGPQRGPRVSRAYVDSARRFDGIARQAGADVILSNHTDWDGSKVNLPRLATRAAGSANPYVVGTPAVRNYLKVAEECATARLMTASARSASLGAPGASARNPGDDWPTYNRDLAGTRYSPLTQINTQNVSRSSRRGRIGCGPSRAAPSRRSTNRPARSNCFSRSRRSSSTA